MPEAIDTQVFDLELLLSSHGASSELYGQIKRVIDVVGASALLLLTAPLMLLIALIVRLTSRGTAFFVQPRIGYHCREFRMYKFRTMVDGAHRAERSLAHADGTGVFLKLADDPRVTWFGKLLRKTSLDELPQLANVLKGEMSLVGPRPLLLSDFEKFPRSAQMKRFCMQPGLTGLWQVSGRSMCADVERIRLDSEYVENWSLRLDVKILLKTVPVVLSGYGAT